MVALVFITTCLIFGIYAKYASIADKDNGADVAGIKCEINVSDDSSDPTKYSYIEIKEGIGNLSSTKVYAIALDIRVTSLGSETAYDYTVSLNLKSPDAGKTLSNTTFVCPVSSPTDLSGTGTGFTQGKIYVKAHGAASYTAVDGSVPAVSGTIGANESHILSIIVFSTVPGNSFPEDYIVTYDLSATQREVA